MTIDVASPETHSTPAPTATRPLPLMRVGVVGTGEQTGNHLLPALLRVPGARVTALVDPATSRRDDLADRIGVRLRLDTVEQFLDSG